MSSVDVIVPCYRYGHFLRECVESVLAQSISDVRVLILDDASPDNTAEVAAELANEDTRVRFVRHITNKGHIATYNEGIEWASADYLLLLSADDYLLPGTLSQATNLMDTYPEVGFTFGQVIELNDSRNKSEIKIVANVGNKKKWRILTGLEFIELSGSQNLVPTATAVIRTELQKKVGGYRKELPHTADMEMWLRLAAHASVGSFEEYQAVYRRHADNMSHGYYRANYLPDLDQRKAAVDFFVRSCGHMLENAQQLHRKMLWSLGCRAIGFASAAFNDGDLEGSNRLSQFALSVCPKIKQSLPWSKLACKRYMGLKRWRVLQPAIARLRELVLRK